MTSYTLSLPDWHNALGVEYCQMHVFNSNRPNCGTRLADVDYDPDDIGPHGYLCLDCYEWCCKYNNFCRVPGCSNPKILRRAHELYCYEHSECSECHEVFTQLYRWGDTYVCWKCKLELRLQLQQQQQQLNAAPIPVVVPVDIPVAIPMEIDEPAEFEMPNEASQDELIDEENDNEFVEEEEEEEDAVSFLFKAGLSQENDAEQEEAELDDCESYFRMEMSQSQPEQQLYGCHGCYNDFMANPGEVKCSSCVAKRQLMRTDPIYMSKTLKEQVDECNELFKSFTINVSTDFDLSERYEHTEEAGRIYCAHCEVSYFQNAKSRLVAHIMIDHFGVQPGDHIDEEDLALPSSVTAECRHCNRHVPRAGFSDHLRFAHGLSFRCGIGNCTFGSATERLIQHHRSLNHNETCHLCQQDFRNVTYTARKFHFVNKHSGYSISYGEHFKLQECYQISTENYFCTLRFDTNEEKERHITIVHLLRCPYSPSKSFVGKETVRKHLQNVHNETL